MQVPILALSETAEAEQASRTRLVVNAGCGPRNGRQLPAMFEAWRQLRVDVDPALDPDVIADITDLSAIPSGSADAVWSAHCLEHLYVHQVGRALDEFHRVLRNDGFACIIVPDLQTIASYIVSDQLEKVLYESPAGPITPHDVMFGLGAAVARGHVSMAHRCGFTPSAMLRHLHKSRFAEIVLRRRPSLELAAVALKKATGQPDERERLLAELAL
jgi:SAM-dependent methyltransferase